MKQLTYFCTEIQNNTRFYQDCYTRSYIQWYCEIPFKKHFSHEQMKTHHEADLAEALDTISVEYYNKNLE